MSCSFSQCSTHALSMCCISDLLFQNFQSLGFSTWVRWLSNDSHQLLITSSWFAQRHAEVILVYPCPLPTTDKFWQPMSGLRFKLTLKTNEHAQWSHFNLSTMAPHPFEEPSNVDRQYCSWRFIIPLQYLSPLKTTSKRDGFYKLVHESDAYLLGSTKGIATIGIESPCGPAAATQHSTGWDARMASVPCDVDWCLMRRPNLALRRIHAMQTSLQWTRIWGAESKEPKTRDMAWKPSNQALTILEGMSLQPLEATSLYHSMKFPKCRSHDKMQSKHLCRNVSAYTSRKKGNRVVRTLIWRRQELQTNGGEFRQEESLFWWAKSVDQNEVARTHQTEFETAGVPLQHYRTMMYKGIPVSLKAHKSSDWATRLACRQDTSQWPFNDAIQATVKHGCRIEMPQDSLQCTWPTAYYKTFCSSQTYQAKEPTHVMLPFGCHSVCFAIICFPYA